MADDERLREALLELQLLREREARNHKETHALLSGLECIRSDQSRAKSIHALLSVISQSVGCDLTLILRNSDQGSVVLHACSAGFEGLSWSSVGVPIRKSRRIVDVRSLIEADNDVPEPLQQFRAMITEPLEIDQSEAAVLLCLSREKGQFTKADSRLLGRFGKIASQAMAGLELEENNAFLAAVIAGSSSSFAIGDFGDGDLSLSYVNKAFERLTGYDQSEALGGKRCFFSSEPEESKSLQAFRDAINNREHGTFLLQNQRKNGEAFWNQITLSPIIDEDGVANHMVATQIDVSPQVKAEQDRDEARQRLEDALSSTGEGFLALDADGKVLFANTRFVEFVSLYKVDWGVGWHFTDIWKRYLMKAGMPEQMAQEKAEEYLERLMTKARSLETHLPDGRVVLVNERPIVGGGAVIVAADVTALKSAEQSLMQRAAAIENVQDGIAITDVDGLVSYANPSLLALWNITREADIVGRSWVGFYAPQEVKLITEKLENLSPENSLREELRLDDAVFKSRVHEVSLTPVADLGNVLTVHDISDRLKDERERAVLRERIQAAQRQEALGQMAAGLAHDFNNLLSAITGSATLITDHPDSTPETRKNAERIAKAGFRAAELVNNLLDLGSREQSKELIDLKNMLGEALELARSSIGNNAQLVSDLGDHPVLTFASQTDVLQLVLNLILNAQDALPMEGGKITLRITRDPILPDRDKINLGRLDPNYSYVAISVEDTGSGISPDNLENVFKPYFTTKGNLGTGLGLAVVSSVVKANDGGLTVHNNTDGGTTFVVYWPLSERPTDAVENEQEIAPDVDLSGLPVLVVDDDLAVAQVIATLLELNGAEVSIVDDPQIALEALSADPDSWGCLVTDYDMPEMNGGELVEKITEIAPNIPRIVVTALARRLRDPRLNNQSVDAILAKPVDPTYLVNAVKSAVVRRRANLKESE